MPLWFNSLKSISHRTNMKVPIERSRQFLSVGSYFLVVRVVRAELQSCNGIWLIDHMPLWFNSLKSISHRTNMKVPMERSCQALSVGSLFVVVRVVIAELQSCNGIWLITGYALHVLTICSYG